MGLGKNPKSNGRTDGQGNTKGSNGNGLQFPATREGKQLGQVSGASKYDPAEYIIPGQDAQGHSERVYCRVQPGLAMQVNRIKSEHKFPFRTEGDIMRWALWTGVKLLEIMEPTPNNFIVRAEAVNGILREEVYNQEYMSTVDSLQRVVNQYLAMGAVGEARRTVAKVKAQWEQLEEPYWRKRCLDEISNKFGHLLKSEKAASLITNEEVEGEGKDGG